MTLPILTAHLRQLEESGLKAGMPPVGVGYQRDKEDVLGGEESQVVGGRVGATQPARQRNGVSDRPFTCSLASDQRGPGTSFLTLHSSTEEQGQGQKVFKKMRHSSTHLKPQQQEAEGSRLA